MADLRSSFHALLNQGDVFDRKSVSSLEKLARRYPYCQPLRMLYAKALRERDKKRFEQEVNLATALAPDRRRFRAFLSGEKPTLKEPDTVPASMNEPATTEQSKPDKSAKKRQNNQQRIIDRFLSQEPRIEQRAKNVPEGELAPESQAEHPDMVSETLADLLVKQGKPDRAAVIYKKLSLMFPEKSRYFAKKLKKIERTTN
ncbi:MAG: hypothetical protein R6U62_10345 [Bacteroidales bacterium]